MRKPFLLFLALAFAVSLLLACPDANPNVKTLTIADIEIPAIEGDESGVKLAKLTINGDQFKAIDSSVDISSWFDFGNDPITVALSANVADGATELILELKVTGEASVGQKQYTLTIPAEYLKKNKALIATLKISVGATAGTLSIGNVEIPASAGGEQGAKSARLTLSGDEFNAIPASGAGAVDANGWFDFEDNAITASLKSDVQDGATELEFEFRTASTASIAEKSYTLTIPAEYLKKNEQVSTTVNMKVVASGTLSIPNNKITITYPNDNGIDVVVALIDDKFNAIAVTADAASWFAPALSTFDNSLSVSLKEAVAKDATSLKLNFKTASTESIVEKSGYELTIPAEYLQKNEPAKIENLSIAYAKPSYAGLVFVEGGDFTIGSSTDTDYENDPVNVTLSTFYISDHEVTQKEYKDVIGSNPSKNKADDDSTDDFPVENLTWLDAVRFCNALSAADGLSPCYTLNGAGTDVASYNLKSGGYHLPTEAQWEYAARGGQSGKANNYTYSGSNAAGDVAWYDDNSNNTTHAVKGKQANELGLYDMTGNVEEWCNDWYAEGYTPGTDPEGPSSGEERVYRGGYFYSYNKLLSPSVRNCIIPVGFGNGLGFRLARL